MKTVDYRDEILVIRFSGEGFSENLTTVKKLIGSTFMMAGKYWTAPATEFNIKLLLDNHWSFSPTASALLFKKEKVEVKIDESKLLNFYEYQKEGVKWLEGVDGIGMVNDEMGLGKTAQSIGYCKIHPEKRPVLVVCPASVKLNWKREIELWTGNKNITIIYGKRASALPKSDWYIINYDILMEESIDPSSKQKTIANSSWVLEFVKVGIQVLIIDEFHMISNNTAIRTKAIKYLRKNCKGVKFIGLSGTPLRNRPSEFFTMLNLVAPKVFTNRWKYLQRYCDPKFNGFGWEFNGASNIEELNQLIKPYMIRRLKSEVLTQLPPKIKSVVPMELEEVQRNNYFDAEGEFADWLDDNLENFKEQQTQIEKLKQLAYLAKRNSVFSWIEDFLSSGQKLVVMCYHKIAMEDLYNRFRKVAVRLDGSTPQKDRQKAIDDFQKNPAIRLFIGQILAAGVGITLTAANSLAFIEYTFTPSDHAQAEDRIHRIGQESDSVNIYYLTADQTIENTIVDMIISKNKVIKNILDGKQGEDFFDGSSDSLVRRISSKFARIKQ